MSKADKKLEGASGSMVKKTVIKGGGYRHFCVAEALSGNCLRALTNLSYNI